MLGHTVRGSCLLLVQCNRTYDAWQVGVTFSCHFHSPSQDQGLALDKQYHFNAYVWPELCYNVVHLEVLLTASQFLQSNIQS